MLEIKGAETGNMPLASTGFPNVRINLKLFQKWSNALPSVGSLLQLFKM